MSFYDDLCQLAKSNGIRTYGTLGRKSAVHLVSDLQNAGVEVPDESLPPAFKNKANPETMPTKPEGVSQEEFETQLAEAERLLKEAKKKRGSPLRATDVLRIDNKDPRFHYRWVKRDMDAIQKRLDQGYTFLDGNTGIPGKVVDNLTIQDGKPIDGIRAVKRELVAMAIPKDPYVDQWKEAQAEKNERAIRDISPEAVKRRVQAQHGTGAEIRGNLKIYD